MTVVLTVVRLALVLAVVAILIALLVVVGPYRWGCEGVDVESLTEAEAASLVGRGWAGDPEDQREALYPPGCLERR